MLPLLIAASISALVPFNGNWQCAGRFEATGNAISSGVTMSLDRGSGAFIVRHDDEAPAAYHSVELWSADPKGALHAAVADEYSGLRVFDSPPVAEGLIVFARLTEAGGREEFRYHLVDAKTLEIKWSVARDGGQLRLGDTLTCRRQAS